MSVNIDIRRQDPHAPMPSVPELAALTGLAYGRIDRNYKLVPGEIDEDTTLFDPGCIGRGFEVAMEEDVYHLTLPLPSTPCEIDRFYTLVKMLSLRLGATCFRRNGQLALPEDCDGFIDDDYAASEQALLQLDNAIRSGEKTHIYVFAAMNPIDLALPEIDAIAGTPEGFEDFLNRTQQKSIWYAEPRFFRRDDDTVFGVYTIAEQVPTVVGLVPELPFPANISVDSWYVMLPENNVVPYDVFINFSEEADVYDSRHIIVKLSESMINTIAEEAAVDPMTQAPVQGGYRGHIIDDIRGHRDKICRKHLNTETLAAASHMAVFLLWIIRHDMLSDELLAERPDLPALAEDTAVDLRTLIRDDPLFDGRLKASHFNAAGRLFALAYYVFDTDDGYPACVDAFAETCLGKDAVNDPLYQDEAYLFLPYDDAYIRGLSEAIDEAYEAYLSPPLI